MHIPNLYDIDETKFIAEHACVEKLLCEIPYDEAASGEICATAAAWVRTLREEREKHTLLDTFLSEYGLTNEEGVALMCLAEAFLRIPDPDTAQYLLKDKVGTSDWRSHLGHADNWLVNSSTWALMLTGRVFTMDESHSRIDWLSRLMASLGRSAFLNAVRHAMKLLGSEFVLGESIEDAVDRTVDQGGAKTRYSFDMLGEGARTFARAQSYFEAYAHAIRTVAHGSKPHNSISIKLSALHPRYEPLQQARVHSDMLQRLHRLCDLAGEHDIALTIDAEESDRLLFSLDLFAHLFEHTGSWPGLGIVVQAYGKRAPGIIDWLAELSRVHNKRTHVRLVKGAYWDAEIKQAQQLGLDDYPVYTRKPTTDAAYLHCAAKLLAADGLVPQFATHNAHTIAAVLNIAKPGGDFEFQRLHGMGEHLYDLVRRDHANVPVRVYAPVGHHQDLLAYLVRRLLENGANSSFVNAVLDRDADPDQLVLDPFQQLASYEQARHPNISLPSTLYGSERVNSPSWDTSNPGRVSEQWCTVPAEVPAVADYPLPEIANAFERAGAAQAGWEQLGGGARADIFMNAARRLNDNRQTLYALLREEAGKTLQDAVSEVREAADFCRYYSVRGRELFEAAINLPGATGETNQMSLHGRGTFVCISPWNFPLAILLGQISAALMAGNTVLAKPAEATPNIARFAVNLLHQAGVPKDVCQLIPGDADHGKMLVAHPGCAGVAFTGSTNVARQINLTLAQRAGPILPFIAETGGINAMIVDSTALLEQMCDDVIRSAFSSAGQRCSALRLLCLQDEIYDAAMEMIQGAMETLHVGAARHPYTDIGPIISKQAHARLAQHVIDCRSAGHTVFQPHQACTLADTLFPPTLIELDSPRQLQEEHFGPILHVVRYQADQLELLVDEINALGFGLTSGVHTRLQHRADHLSRKINAGNIYINRDMIGAVVGSQPFGGQGLSGTGPKAGGPHYLPRFAIERVVSTNTTASGGNIALLCTESNPQTKPA